MSRKRFIKLMMSRKGIDRRQATLYANTVIDHGVSYQLYFNLMDFVTRRFWETLDNLLLYFISLPILSE